MPRSTGSQQADVTALIHAARRSDEHAWTQLHRQFDPTLRNIARSRGLSSHDIDDAVQNTWIKLHARIDSIREPAAIAGWLATTVRRESLRLMQTHVRELLTDDPTSSADSQQDGPEARLLEHERRTGTSAPRQVMRYADSERGIAYIAVPGNALYAVGQARAEPGHTNHPWINERNVLCHGKQSISRGPSAILWRTLTPRISSPSCSTGMKDTSRYATQFLVRRLQIPTRVSRSESSSTSLKSTTTRKWDLATGKLRLVSIT
jgi:hypothetical protein